ncbi:MAG: DUF6291 domain-containing protein [Smithella sp.]
MKITPKSKKNYLLSYDDPTWENLSNEMAGQVIKKINRSKSNGHDLSDPIAKFAYQILKGKIQQDYDKWAEICEKNKENAKKKWEKFYKTKGGKEVNSDF